MDIAAILLKVALSTINQSKGKDRDEKKSVFQLGPENRGAQERKVVVEQDSLTTIVDNSIVTMDKHIDKK